MDMEGGEVIDMDRAMQFWYDEFWSQPWHQEVLKLCEAHGFGAVMQSAAEQWRKRDPVGALTVGPCVYQKKSRWQRIKMWFARFRALCIPPQRKSHDR